MSNIVEDKVNLIKMYSQVISIAPHVAINIFAILKYFDELLYEFGWPNSELKIVKHISSNDTLMLIDIYNSIKNEILFSPSDISIENYIQRILIVTSTLITNLSPIKSSDPLDNVQLVKIKHIADYIYASLLGLTLSKKTFKSIENKTLASKKAQINNILIITNNIKNKSSENYLKSIEYLDVLLACIGNIYKQIHKFNLMEAANTKYMSIVNQMGGGNNKTRKSKLSKLRAKLNQKNINLRHK